MRRQLLTLALTGLFGTLLLSSDASACHKRGCKTQTCAPVQTVVVAPCPPPAPVCQPAPVCEPAPTCARPRRKLFGGLCHKKKACVSTVYYAAPAPCDTPVYSSYQSVAPSYQSVAPSGQGY